MTLKCPVCGSTDTAKKGFRKNRTGKKQKYRCYDCKNWFVKDDGFKHMRFRKDDIVRAVHMHEDGLSLSKVQNHLWQHDGIKVTRWTISEWTKKFSVFLKSDSSGTKAKH